MREALGSGRRSLPVLEPARRAKRLPDDATPFIVLDDPELAGLGKPIADHAIDDHEALLARRVRRAGIAVAVDDQERHGRCSPRSGRRRDAEVGADLAGEPEVDLAVTRDGRRALGVEAPEAVVAALAQQSGPVSA